MSNQELLETAIDELNKATRAIMMNESNVAANRSIAASLLVIARNSTPEQPNAN